MLFIRRIHIPTLFDFFSKSPYIYFRSAKAYWLKSHKVIHLALIHLPVFFLRSLFIWRLHVQSFIIKKMFIFTFSFFKKFSLTESNKRGCYIEERCFVASCALSVGVLWRNAIWWSNLLTCPFWILQFSFTMRIYEKSFSWNFQIE